jgi:branched-chain amino acid transport system substrate-binding protein
MGLIEGGSRMRRWSGLPIVVALLLSVVTGCSQIGGGNSGNIVFGVSGPLTGPNAEYGQIWKKAFDIAVDEVNAKGGIKGRKIEIQFEDTQSDPKQSVVVAEKFANDKRIVAEIGDFASPASMAASPIYERAGLVQYGFTNSHPDFTKGGNFMFSTAPNQADDAPFLANYAVKEIGKKKLVLLHQNTDWGKTTADLFEAKAKELGAQIVYRDAYLPDEKDFKTIITKARDANPDGLALMSYYTDAALIAQQAKAQGLNVDIIANGASYSPKFIELGGEAVEGVKTTSPWFVGNPRPAVQEFVKKYKDKYGEDPNWFAGNAYDTVMILSNVIEKVGTDRKAIRDGLAGLKDYPSLVYGTLSFNSDRRAEIKEFNRLTVKGGQFVLWKAS